MFGLCVDVLFCSTYHTLRSLFSPNVLPAHNLFFVPLLSLIFLVYQNREKNGEGGTYLYSLYRVCGIQFCKAVSSFIDWYHQLSMLYRAEVCL